MAKARASSFIAKALVGVKGSMRWHLLSARHEAGRHQSIIACVFSMGERTEARSIESLHKQTLKPSHIELIRNVSPISAASNFALEKAQGFDHLLWVDADMILYPHCTESLLKLVQPDTLYSVGTLLDPVFGKVGYIKLLNMHIVRALNLSFRDVLGCDVDFCRQAKKRDSALAIESYTLLRKPLGVHHPTYTARELFRKNQIEKKKRGNKTDAKLLGMLARKYHADPNPVLLSGMLGEILPNPDLSNGESGLGSGLDLWETVRTILKDIPEDLSYGFPDGV